MRRAGVDVVFDIERLGVIGIFEVLLHLKAVTQAYRSAVRILKEGVDLLVLIDYPDFNLRLAKAAKRIGIPVVYYISPQIWAWRSGRIKTIAERVDKMLVILPFEKEIYDRAGIPCEYVGHPLLEAMDPASNPPFSRETYLRMKGLDPSRRVVGLLPGSRKREVSFLLPTLLKSVELLAKEIPGLQVLIPVASSLPKSWVAGIVHSSSAPITLVEGEAGEVMRASDALVVASGTATLQAALAGTPMVVVYKVAPLTYRIARRMIHLRSIGLVNIVAGAPIAPELIQSDANQERIRREVASILSDDARREKMIESLKGIAVRLGVSGASFRAAAAIE
ncbi:MAG TPA: lipid-A-disaccharide synthase, partial [Candidatus Manganitrophaceae bacterium]